MTFERSYKDSLPGSFTISYALTDISLRKASFTTGIIISTERSKELLKFIFSKSFICLFSEQLKTKEKMFLHIMNVQSVFTRFYLQPKVPG